VHSNIDDGYAAQFTDLASCLGMMEIEREIVEDLIGARMSHCFGHHFSNPLTRLAFQRALARRTDVPGTMIYGNTTSYRGTPAENYAGLARYLNIDAIGQTLAPTGHAINAVPVTENERIPDIEEIIDAQLFAGRVTELLDATQPPVDLNAVDVITEKLVDGAIEFASNVRAGLTSAGIDTGDPFEMLLALRRIGARKLEQLFGVGRKDPTQIGGRIPVVAGSVLEEIGEMADTAMEEVDHEDFEFLKTQTLRVLVATTDVHEHGKLLIEEILRRTGIEIIDGGVSTEPHHLAEIATRTRPDAVAISTYNGVALTYFTQCMSAMTDAGLEIPVLIGGRLNQIPEATNSSLPVDVGEQLSDKGAIVCRQASDMIAHLRAVVTPGR